MQLKIKVYSQKCVRWKPSPISVYVASNFQTRRKNEFSDIGNLVYITSPFFFRQIKSYSFRIVKQSCSSLETLVHMDTDIPQEFESAPSRVNVYGLKAHSTPLPYIPLYLAPRWRYGIVR